MVIIIDYGVGNIGSIYNIVKKCTKDVLISRDFQQINSADKLILPGVGSFDYAINKIDEYHLRNVLNYLVLEKQTPILGICLGMQIMLEDSEEGILPGLGWIEGHVLKFNIDGRIPHMGWNTVTPIRKSALLDPYEENKFYFVHSYYAQCELENTLCKTKYNDFDFCSGIIKDNIYGVQFHPEKSHEFGKQLIKKFIEL